MNGNPEMWEKLLQALKLLGVADSALYLTGAFFVILLNIIWYALLFLLWNILQKLNTRFFQRLIRKKGKTLNLEFLQRVFSFAFTVLCVILAFGYDNLRNSLQKITQESSRL